MKRIFTISLCIALLFSAGCKTASSIGSGSPSSAFMDENIGVIFGSAADSRTDLYGENMNIAKYDSRESSVNALINGEIKCILTDIQLAQQITEDNKNLAIKPDPFIQADYVIMLPEKEEKLLSQINDAISTLKVNGTIDRILRYYLENDDGKPALDIFKKDEKTLSETLTVAVNPDFEPYEYYSYGEITGIDIDIAHAIADILGKKLKLIDVSEESMSDAVLNGKADIAVSAIDAASDIPDKLVYSDIYTSMSQVFVIRQADL